MNKAIRLRLALALALASFLVVAPCFHDASNATEGLLGELSLHARPVLWTDHVIHGDWRIQKNEVLGHFRLLNHRERTMHAGSLNACYFELDSRRRRGEIEPMPTHVVILLHGLAGTRGIMEGMSEYLHDRGGFTVLSFGYASTKGTIQELTVALDSVVRNLQGVQEVSFVGHSMGNILVRHLLYRYQVYGDPPPIAFRRMVMISPPNHGADIADTIGQSRIIQGVLGDVVDQFAPEREWPALERQLLTPWFEFGILAGGRGNENGYLPRVPGDDDGLISLQTHILNGARDFRQIGGLHQWMPRYRQTQESTLRFLHNGHF